jgi:2-enoate reductase
MRMLERGKIGTMLTKNRVIMAPMGPSGLADSDGGFSQRIIDYYAARAKGDVGLIVTGCCFVDTTVDPGLALVGQMRVDSPANQSRLSKLCDAIHHYGAKIAIQLSPGMGRVRPPLPDVPPPVSASEVPCFWYAGLTTHELTVDEIRTLVKAYATAASMVKSAGVDAIEIHGYGGYLMDQFQTELWNHRTDEYGGDLDGRLRFSLEIIGAARKAVGKGFPLIYKLTAEHHIEGGRDIAEALDIARRLEAAGVDALHVTSGCYEVWHKAIPCMYEPPACQVKYADAAKKTVGIPVIADGKLGDPKVAQKVIEEGKADFVSLGRPLLADPDWTEKVKQGSLDEIRPCIGDLDGCMGRSIELKSLSCTVNPATGNEREYALTRASNQKSVLVIGGGPAGLEAARVAALRGHQVTLWEKDGQLGGKLLAASVPAFKQDIRPLIGYLSRQIKKLGVNVELMKEATPELVKQMNPDVVLVATGATPLVPEIAGLDGKNVLTAIDVLLGRKVPGKRVVVAGGGMVGCETAVYLDMEGKQVTIVEMLRQLMPEKMNMLARNGLSDLVQESKIEVLTRAKLVEVNKEGVVVETRESRRDLKCDSVVLALGFGSESGLCDALDGMVSELVAIGDSVKPRNIIDAMWEGFHAARVI